MCILVVSAGVRGVLGIFKTLGSIFLLQIFVPLMPYSEKDESSENGSDSNEFFDFFTDDNFQSYESNDIFNYDDSFEFDY